MAATSVPTPELADRGAGGRRLAGLDVARAVALVGVVTMNWTARFNQSAFDATGVGDGPGWLERVLHAYDGPLTTRFAAALVTIAGVGVSLLASRGDVTANRWRLRRRGVLLYAFGFGFEWVWGGQILSYFGAFLVLGSFLVTVPTRWLLTAAAAAGAAAAFVTVTWYETATGGHDWLWLLSVEPDSPRNLLFNTAVNGTHPLIPWLAFFLTGMAVGRLDLGSAAVRHRIVAVGVALVVAGYGTATILTRAASGVWSDLTAVAVAPYRPLYVLVAVGTSLAAVGLLTGVRSPWLARAGQMTLSLYLLHAFLANVLIDWLQVEDVGLVPSLALSLGYWVLAVAAASAWRARIGPGPAEWVYRQFGG